MTLADLDHWSPSKFQAWDRCPTSFRDKYVLGLAESPTPAMRFGSAVHLGLQAHYSGADGDKAFRAAWHGHVGLTVVGLDLLARVYELDLSGTPEEYWKISTELVWGLPTLGYIDLIDHANKTIYDVKTTIGEWSQARADRDLWQPTLYQWAVLQNYGQLYDFQYLVLNRRTLDVSTIGPSTGFSERWDQVYEAGRMISSMVRDQAFPCAGGHGKCPECGENWQHEHVCDWTVAEPRLHIKRPPGLTDFLMDGTPAR